MSILERILYTFLAIVAFYLVLMVGTFVWEMSKRTKWWKRKSEGQRRSCRYFIGGLIALEVVIVVVTVTSLWS